MPYFSVGIEIISYIVFFANFTSSSPPPQPHKNSKRLSQFVTKEKNPSPLLSLSRQCIYNLSLDAIMEGSYFGVLLNNFDKVS